MRTTIVALAVTAGLMAAAPASAATTVVAPATLGAWQTFLVDRTGANLAAADGGVSFVEGPAGQPSGAGSARLVTATGHGDGGARLRSTGFAGTPLSAIKAMTYATYTSQTNGAQIPYLHITIDLDANGSPDDEIFFEPVYQTAAGLGVAPQPAIALGAWQVWNARAGLWWSQRGLAGSSPGGATVTSLDAMILAAPLARIVNPPGGAGGVSLSSGVVAADQRFDGNVDAFTIDIGSGPTTYDFEPGPPPPVRNQSAVVTAVQGTIKVTLPGKRARKLRSRGENVPLGTVVDASKGRAAIATVNARGAKPQSSWFYDGTFSVTQRGGVRPVTDIKLRSPRFLALCGSAATSAGAARAGAIVSRATRKRRRSKRVVSSLWGDGKGSFRTTGRNSAATVRGTKWLTQERCDGTLTRVVRGVVKVKNLHTGKVITITGGHSYLSPS
jgi:hypothetical protein